MCMAGVSHVANAAQQLLCAQAWTDSGLFGGLSELLNRNLASIR